MPDSLDNLEKDYFNTIRKNCKIIFDVGASDYSIFFEEKEFEVHYFEPFIDPFLRLKEKNILNEKKHLINLGLSNKKENLPYFLEGSLFDRNMSKSIIGNCEVVTGKEYCETNNIIKIDFLKIDVEGMETKVLLGFGDFLKNIRYIQFEYGIGLRDAGSNLKEIMDLLKSYGFNDFYKNGKQKLNSTDDFWEWCNINTENINFI